AVIEQKTVSMGIQMDYGVINHKLK
ncbi:hypothetical protein SAMN05216498_0380, partial [Tenuibacillus multivorans]